MLKNKPQQAIFKKKQKSPFGLLLSKINKTPFIILLALAALSILYAFAKPSKEEIIRHRNVQLELPSSPLVNLIALPTESETVWKEIIVKKGQTLSSIFDDMELSQTLLYKIIHINKDAKSLTKIYPGATLAFAFDNDGSFAQLKYPISETQELFVLKNDKELSTKIITHETETQVQTADGTITGSLFNAGKKAGLSDAMVMRLANVFAWDIDFVLDIRQGDSFNLIYEKIYKDGEFLRDGRIIAASFTNQGDTYKAISFEDGNGWSFYNPEGRNMKKAFLRAPLNFSYISSNFNPKRFHPVQKRVKAHRGIDYAAPTGTPVYAAGDGVVTRSSYNKYNGNHVFIKHPSGIVTKYLHFNKRKVKKGQRVRQGQTIGTVGSTGMVTGAHLHYEFVLNGVHRNPRTVKLPKASPLAKDKMKIFTTYAKPLIALLDGIGKSNSNIASNKTASSSEPES